MKKQCAAVILIVMIMLISCGYAESVGPNNAVNYNKAKNYAELAFYSDARELFAALGSYKDSALWYCYCDAMVKLDEADEKESQGYLSDAKALVTQAKESLILLDASVFEDAAGLISYCTAREYQLRGLLQNAENMFSTVLGVRDARTRFMNIRNRVSLPTQAPVQTIPEALVPVRAAATRQVDIYAGPGKDYKKIKDFTVNAESEIWICACTDSRKETGWYLMETSLPDGKVRFWANRNGHVYAKEQSTLAEVMKNAKTAWVSKAAAAKYGPGEEYADCGVTVEANTTVTRYDSEGLYTMIEITDEAGKKACVWIPSNCLQ